MGVASKYTTCSCEAWPIWIRQLWDIYSGRVCVIINPLLWGCLAFKWHGDGCFHTYQENWYSQTGLLLPESYTLEKIEKEKIHNTLLVCWDRLCRLAD